MLQRVSLLLAVVSLITACERPGPRVPRLSTQQPPAQPTSVLDEFELDTPKFSISSARPAQPLGTPQQMLGIQCAFPESVVVSLGDRADEAEFDRLLGTGSLICALGFDELQAISTATGSVHRTWMAQTSPTCAGGGVEADGMLYVSKRDAFIEYTPRATEFEVLEAIAERCRASLPTHFREAMMVAPLRDCDGLWALNRGRTGDEETVEYFLRSGEKALRWTEHGQLLFAYRQRFGHAVTSAELRIPKHWVDLERVEIHPFGARDLNLFGPELLEVQSEGGTELWQLDFSTRRALRLFSAMECRGQLFPFGNDSSLFVECRCPQNNLCPNHWTRAIDVEHRRAYELPLGFEDQPMFLDANRIVALTGRSAQAQQLVVFRLGNN